MYKNQRGYSVFVILVTITVICTFSSLSWYIYGRQKAPQDLDSATNNTSSSTQTEHKRNIEPGLVKTDDNLLDNNPRDTPYPTAPRDLKVTPKESGYYLTWDQSVSAGSIIKYQVFYQNNLIAEPTNTNYLHELPPPPPGCTPISLTYYVVAVVNDEQKSSPSDSVTVQFGGC